MSDPVWAHMEFVDFFSRFIIEVNFVNVFIWFIVICLGFNDTVFVAHEKMAGVRHVWFAEVEVRVFSECSL